MSDKAIIRLSKNPQGFGDEPDKLEADMFASEIPLQNSHEYYADDELGLYVGVWDTNDMVEAAGPYAMDEFMCLLEGSAGVKNSKTGVMQKAQAGEVFIIPKGYDCQWHQSGYLRKYFMISEHPEEEIPAQPSIEGIVIPGPDAVLNPVTSSQPFLMKGNVVPKAHESYVDTRGRFYAGTWGCDAFDSESRPFPHYQLSCVQEGSIALIDACGETHVFNAGDAFFVPQGTLCSGLSSAGVRLFYSILTTA
jgi:uncharacterized cupin superfamily protein